MRVYELDLNDLSKIMQGLPVTVGDACGGPDQIKILPPEQLRLHFWPASRGQVKAAPAAAPPKPNGRKSAISVKQQKQQVEQAGAEAARCVVEADRAARKPAKPSSPKAGSSSGPPQEDTFDFSGAGDASRELEDFTEQCEEYLEFVGSDDFPAEGGDYAESTSEKVVSMRDSATERGSASPKMVEAVSNMRRGAERWVENRRS